jgi:hypothetical protein
MTSRNRQFAIVLSIVIAPAFARAQSFCAEFTKAVDYALQDFASIKGVQDADDPTVFDASFSITSVDPECLLIASDGRPAALSLVCGTRRITTGCPSVAAKEYERISSELRACISEKFPSAIVKDTTTDLKLTNSTTRGVGIRASNLGESASGFRVNATASWTHSVGVSGRTGKRRETCGATLHLTLD